MSYLIRVQDITKRYDGFALEHVNIAVEAGSVVGFVGTNGAGKTTTLKAILGLIAVDEGTIELLGQPVTVSSKTIDDLKSRIGIVFDTCAFPGTCRVSDVGSMGRGAYPAWDQSRFEELCQTFKLAPKKKVQELSRGMGMKLTLSFALAHDPELLILDEATAGLDPMARDEVLDILRQFMNQPGHGILMSTHITSDLEKIADEVICIDEGRIIFDLPRETISDEAGIAHLRSGEVETVLENAFIDPAEVRFMHGTYSTDLLVPDRFTFSRAFPNIPVTPATIEDFMTFTLKGEMR